VLIGKVTTAVALWSLLLSPYDVVEVHKTGTKVSRGAKMLFKNLFVCLPVQNNEQGFGDMLSLMTSICYVSPMYRLGRDIARNTKTCF
jgi:hypothetical protein